MLELPWFVSGVDDDDAISYMSAAHEVLAADACGWIIDLLGNEGGNLFAMLVAIGPLLGAGPTVGYRDRHEATDIYDLRADGSLVTSDGTVLAEPPADAFAIEDREIPIAVLQGGLTASSGEGVVMALRGRPDVRTFGTPTYGLPTGNSFFDMPDGSGLNLTTAVGVDFGGEAHEQPIPSDVPVSPASRTNVLESARTWLLDQPACAA